VLTDRLLRRGTEIASLVPDHAKYRNPAGVISLVVAGIISIGLFSNQIFYTGLVVQAAPQIGDLTPLVGFLVAGVLYWVLFRAFKVKLGGPFSGVPTVVIGVDAADDVA